MDGMVVVDRARGALFLGTARLAPAPDHCEGGRRWLFDGRAVIVCALPRQAPGPTRRHTALPSRGKIGWEPSCPKKSRATPRWR